MATGDQYIDKVVLGCSFDDGIVDESPSPKKITAYGNATVSSTQKKYGAMSCYFGGGGGYLAVTTGSEFAFGTADFTIECWVNVTNYIAARSIFYKYITWSSNMDFALRVDATTGLVRFFGGDGAPIILISNAAIATNQWVHLAVTRAAGVTRMYLDGVAQTATHTGSVDIPNDATTLKIGTYDGFEEVFNGYIDDIRITNGVARYTSNFTPEQCHFYHSQLQGTVKDSNGNFARRLVRAHRRSDGKVVDETLSNISTGEFTLNTIDASKHYAVVHDSDAWITYLPFNGDNDSTLIYEWGSKKVTPYGNAKLSTAQSKFGGSSLYLDGAGDYLTLPVSSDLAFGTWDFTIEAWVRLDSTGIERAIFDNRAATSDTGLYFYITAGGQIAAYGNGATIATGSTALSATTWHHVALVKSAGTVTLYLNGVGDGSGASSYVIACPADSVIGRKLGSTANDFAGHIDDLRISKGVARYTADFTPPAAPFPEVLQTFGQQNAMIFDHLTPV